MGAGEGFLVSAYEPAGSLPPGWTYKNLGAGRRAAELSDRRSGSCKVCEEISLALATSAVSEWRALAEAARKAKLADNWHTNGGRLQGPSEHIAADKVEFGTSRIQRWFNRPWEQSPGSVPGSEGSPA